MNSQESINDTYEEVGEMLLIKFVDEKIFGLFKRKGLIGKRYIMKLLRNIDACLYMTRLDTHYHLFSG